jgi:FOG: WD40 repeat
MLAAGSLAAAAIASILLRSPARGGPSGTEPGAEPLLALQREIAAPPDAQGVLGSLDGTVVLSARSAYYLLPADGAHSAVRVPLERDEVLAEPLGGGRILLVRRGRVVARHPTKTEEVDLGPLPSDAPPPLPGRLRCSRSGRFLAVRGDGTLELFERGASGWARRLRSSVPFVEGEVLDVGERLVALAQGGGRPVRAFGLPEGTLLLEAPFAERKVSAVAVDDAIGRVAVGGPFDSVAVFSTGESSSPRLLPRRGWTYGLAWIGDAPTLLASGLDGITAFRHGPEPAAVLSSVSPGGALCVDSDALLSLVPRRQRLAVVSYAGISPTARVPAGGRPLWAAEHDAEGKTVFVGGRDGELWFLDIASLGIRRAGAHTDGIPSMVRDGQLLATSSDDKTVALWALPGPDLKLRTRAHDFLVNDLTVVDGRGARARHGLLGRHRAALELARSRAAGDDRRRGAPRTGGLAPRGRAAARGAPDPRGDLGLEPPRADRARRPLEREGAPGAFEGDLSPRPGAPARALLSRRGSNRRACTSSTSPRAPCTRSTRRASTRCGSCRCRGRTTSSSWGSTGAPGIRSRPRSPTRRDAGR